MSSYFRQQLEEYLKGLDLKADRVLDIGGASNPARNRVGKIECKEYKIFDNGLEEKYGKWTKPDYIGDLNKIWLDWKSELKGLFDLIFCLEVYEYLYNPLIAMSNIYDLLSRKGKAIISFPFVYPLHEPKDYDYLRYTEKGIEKLCQELGFKIERIIPRYARNCQLLTTFYQNEGMHLARGEDHCKIGFIIEVRKE